MIALAGIVPFMPTMPLVHREWLVFWRHPGRHFERYWGNGSGSIRGESFACGRESGGNDYKATTRAGARKIQRARPTILESSNVRRKKRHRQRRHHFAMFLRRRFTIIPTLAIYGRLVRSRCYSRSSHPCSRSRHRGRLHSLGPYSMPWSATAVKACSNSPPPPRRKPPLPRRVKHQQTWPRSRVNESSTRYRARTNSFPKS